YFNEPGHDEYIGYPVIVADSSWSPDGSRIVATVLCGRGREKTEIVIIDVGEALARNGDESPPSTSPSATYVPPHEKGAFVEDFFMYYDLPCISDEERMELALESKTDWREYCESVNDEAAEFSEELADYIRAWYRGEADARLPDGLLPPNIDSDKTHSWTLLRPEDISPEDQWFVMIPTHEIDPTYQELHMFGCDRHVTYVKLLFAAPIGSRLLVEGDFPHARFMDYEILSTFDPAHPVAGNHGSHPEVAIVDADIEPDPGHSNPFRIGADRSAENRHYHLTFELEAGNAVLLNPEAMQAPAYRAPGNTRVGGPFGFSGPWGDGAFTPSTLWLRIYAPDTDTDIMGGVSLPRVMLELDTGEQFWLQPDKTLAVERQTQMAAAGKIAPHEPYPFLGPDLGWFKIFGLRLRRSESSAYLDSWSMGPAETSE
ncbi:MAG: hypothetical protein KAU10_05155, partial [Dehalococcoidia bacterium]|nr:hypothetical protein [Dehalococcoidia bacterium]